MPVVAPGRVAAPRCPSPRRARATPPPGHALAALAEAGYLWTRRRPTTGADDAARAAGARGWPAS